MVAAPQRYRIAGWKRIVQGVIELFIDGDLVAHWNRFDFVIAVHRFPFDLALMGIAAWTNSIS